MAKPVSWRTITIFESDQTKEFIAEMKKDSMIFFQPKEYLSIAFSKE